MTRKKTTPSTIAWSTIQAHRDVQAYYDAQDKKACLLEIIKDTLKKINGES